MKASYRFRQAFLFLLPALSLGVPDLPAQERAEALAGGLRARLQGIVDAFHGGGSFAGVSAAVSLPDGSVLTVVAGEADTARHVPMTPEARMLQGSVGKTYVAAVAMHLPTPKGSASATS
jgi:CubicO group peptidase (beta-lactamase class C family)